MIYDFDTQIDRRGTYCDKWDKYKNTDIIPLWVADMDFASPPPILDALRKRIDHGVLGYTLIPEPLVEAVCAHLLGTYGWEISPDWLVFMPGLVCGLNIACASVGEDNEGVLTATPVYPPFFSAPKNQNRHVYGVPLAKNGERWSLDLGALDKAVQPETKLFLLCNPHNPVGRAFDKEELSAVADWCERRNLVICSDEIHNELILDPEKKHTPIAALSPDIAKRTITLIAPSKTYNIPGLGASIAIIPDNSLRARFKRVMAGIVPHLNVFGSIAAIAAYRECDIWKKELIDYLRINRDLVDREIRSMKGLSITHVEATYLSWIDARGLGVKDPAAFFERAGVGLSDGQPFGSAGFVRLNFGCSRVILAEALSRIKTALINLPR